MAIIDLHGTLIWLKWFMFLYIYAVHDLYCIKDVALHS